MNPSLLSHVIVPIANEDDAVATCEAIESSIDENMDVLTVVHVIEKREGFMDKAPVAARQEQADQVFAIVEDWFESDIHVKRELRYGPDVISEIVAAADNTGATAIGFTPQSSNRLHRLLSGNDSYRLITESEHPVVVFSRVESDDQ